MTRYTNSAEILAQAERAMSPRAAFDYALWLRQIGYAPYFEATLDFVSKGNAATRRLIWC